VAEGLKEEIGSMLEGELSDPRIGFCYVTEVVMNPASKSARVFLAVDGGEEVEEQTVIALQAAKGFIRHELKERMGLQRVPELSCHGDRQEKLQGRIDELLNRAENRARKHTEGQTAAG
jgi:ribosome-binding factor A